MTLSLTAHIFEGKPLHLSATLAFLWRDVISSEYGLCHPDLLTVSHVIALKRRQRAHAALCGTHPLDTGPVQASLSSGFSSLQRLFPLDFVILIFWASFQCQQKSIHSSGRSHQSNGNELFKRPCHGHKLWGNINTLFLKPTLCDLFAVWNVNICFVLHSWCHHQHEETVGGGDRLVAIHIVKTSWSNARC